MLIENNLKKHLILILLCFLITVPVFAEWFASYQAAGFNPDDDNFRKESLANALEAGYSWKYAEIGLEAAHYAPISRWKSTYDDLSLMATLKLKYPIKRLIPYLVTGLGARWYLDKKLNTDPANPGLPERLPNDRSIAVKIGGGLQYEIFKKNSIFIEAAYRYGDTGEPTSIDDYGWSYGAGVKVYF